MANIISKVVKPSLLGLLMACALVGMLPTWVSAESAKQKINTNSFGVAIKGYDTVAYFTMGRAVKGKKEFEFKWQDAEWRFANAVNRDKFAENPETYAPKYGGF